MAGIFAIVLFVDSDISLFLERNVLMGEGKESASNNPNKTENVGRSLALFFLLAYSLMFSIVFIDLYVFDIPYPVVWFISAWSPTISAVIMASVIGKGREVRVLLSGFLKWRVNIAWYLAALVFLIGPLAISIIYTLLGGEAPGIDPSLTLVTFLSVLFFTLASGPLSEEAGWRGFALPRLESKYSALSSSLILGVIWACWHIPLYFVPGSSQSGIPFPIYFAMVIILAILFTWIYNNTKGSLVLTVLAHFAINFSSVLVVTLLGLVPQMLFFISGGIMLAVYVILVIVKFKPLNLSHKSASELPFKRIEG